jgi:hypothetical protein
MICSRSKLSARRQKIRHQPRSRVGTVGINPLRGGDETNAKAVQFLDGGNKGGMERPQRSIFQTAMPSIRRFLLDNQGWCETFLKRP